jgi:molybdopterin molybdotransferase
VPQEDVRRDDHHVALEKAVEPGAYVRPHGQDIRSGDRLLKPGLVLRPAALGVLARPGPSER